MIAGLDWHWRFVDELFDGDPVEQPLVDAGIAVDRAALRPGSTRPSTTSCAKRRCRRPVYPRAVKGGRVGHHSEHLGHLLATMQFLPRTYPDATW